MFLIALETSWSLLFNVSSYVHFSVAFRRSIITLFFFGKRLIITLKSREVNMTNLPKNLYKYLSLLCTNFLTIQTFFCRKYWLKQILALACLRNSLLYELPMCGLHFTAHLGVKLVRQLSRFRTKIQEFQQNFQLSCLQLTIFPTMN